MFGDRQIDVRASAPNRCGPSPRASCRPAVSSGFINGADEAADDRRRVVSPRTQCSKAWRLAAANHACGGGCRPHGAAVGAARLQTRSGQGSFAAPPRTSKARRRPYHELCALTCIIFEHACVVVKFSAAVVEPGAGETNCRCSRPSRAGSGHRYDEIRCLSGAASS